MRKALGTWPLPAVLTWAAAWLLFRALLGQGIALHWALGATTALGVAFSLLGNSWWRRVLIAGGFPLSLALSLPSLGLATLPAWAWLVPLLLLLAVYPLNAWRCTPIPHTCTRPGQPAPARTAARWRPGSGRRLRPGPWVKSPAPRLPTRPAARPGVELAAACTLRAALPVGAGAPGRHLGGGLVFL